MADILLVPEYALTAGLRDAVIGLRAEAFPGYGADRAYFKQLPHHRLLAYEGDQLVGQTGIDYRVVSVGGRPTRTFGLIDLCVAQAMRGKGIGTALLEAVSRLGQANDVPFVLLITDVPHFYARSGYVFVKTDCTWLRIDEHQSLGQTTAYLDDEVMVKSIGGEQWPAGPIDFLGYLF